MSSKLEFLAKLPLFSQLGDEELAALARIAPEFAFSDGSVIAYQRDVADALIIVRNGRLFAKTVDERGIVRQTRSYLPGDYLGELWLFSPDAQPATIVGKGNGSILLIRSADFLKFLSDYPSALASLEPTYDQSDNLVAGLTEEGWAEAQKVMAKIDRANEDLHLLPEELVEYKTRRSRYNLLLRLLLPTILLVSTLVGTLVFVPDSPDNLGEFIRYLGLPTLLTLVALLMIAINFLDWRNDYFIITNKHLIHHEFQLTTFRISISKIPIDKVQSVEVIKASLIANIFNVGTARITTAAQNRVLYFDNIDDPIAVRDTLNRLSQRVRALDAGREQAVMRDSLEGHFRVERPLQPVPEEDESEVSVPTRQSRWRSFWHKYRYRVEDGTTITYHKHLFVLLRNILWPVATLIVLFLLTRLLTVTFQIPISQFWILLLILFLANVIWLAWEIEDWRNDTFQLTDRFVIDIDRRPFGFGESRKQAALSNIQNVKAFRPGLLPTIFNFGTVSVETAGVDADITFEDVPDPSKIQSDIFKRLEEFRQQQRVNEGVQRRKEYAVLLDVYKQALEQGRIPQRTPPLSRND